MDGLTKLVLSVLFDVADVGLGLFDCIRAEAEEESVSASASEEKKKEVKTELTFFDLVPACADLERRLAFLEVRTVLFSADEAAPDDPRGDDLKTATSGKSQRKVFRSPENWSMRTPMRMAPIFP